MCEDNARGAKLALGGALGIIVDDDVGRASERLKSKNTGGPNAQTCANEAAMQFIDAEPQTLRLCLMEGLWSAENCLGLLQHQ